MIVFYLILNVDFKFKLATLRLKFSEFHKVIVLPTVTAFALDGDGHDTATTGADCVRMDLAFKPNQHTSQVMPSGVPYQAKDNDYLC